MLQFHFFVLYYVRRTGIYLLYRKLAQPTIIRYSGEGNSYTCHKIAFNNFLFT
jgi:hypothetical protein